MFHVYPGAEAKIAHADRPPIALARRIAYASRTRHPRKEGKLKPEDQTAPPATLIEAETIAVRIDEMARAIAADLGHDFVMVIVLKGAFVFGADLLRALGRVGARPRVEFLGLSSYAHAKESSGEVKAWTPIPQVARQAALLVEDILDSGLTVTHAAALLREAGATDVKLCALLDKPAGRKVSVAGDYVGFTIPPRFVVGYGIDWAERFRELTDVAAVD